MTSTQPFITFETYSPIVDLFALFNDLFALFNFLDVYIQYPTPHCILVFFSLLSLFLILHISVSDVGPLSVVSIKKLPSGLRIRTKCNILVSQYIRDIGILVE